MNARALLAVFAGGGIGSVARYALTFAFTQRFGPGFPWSTMVINVSGSVAIGVISELTLTRSGFGSPLMRILLMTGVLGGYTTFSTFSLETVQLLHDRAPVSAALYALGSILLGVAGAIAGATLARLL